MTEELGVYLLLGFIFVLMFIVSTVTNSVLPPSDNKHLTTKEFKESTQRFRLEHEKRMSLRQKKNKRKLSSRQQKILGEQNDK